MDGGRGVGAESGLVHAGPGVHPRLVALTPDSGFVGRIFVI